VVYVERLGGEQVGSRWYVEQLSGDQLVLEMQELSRDGEDVVVICLI
jgi:hypothetical protein